MCPAAASGRGAGRWLVWRVDQRSAALLSLQWPPAAAAAAVTLPASGRAGTQLRHRVPVPWTDYNRGQIWVTEVYTDCATPEMCCDRE